MTKKSMGKPKEKKKRAYSMSSETRIVLRLPHCSVRLQAKKVLQTKFAAREMETASRESGFEASDIQA
jgi:hypothetical protein